MEKLKEALIVIGAIAGGITAVSIVMSAVLDVAPWATKDELIESNKAISEAISDNERGVAYNRELIYRSKVEWLERRKYDADTRCDQGDSRACIFARDLETSIQRTRDLLDQLEADKLRSE